MKSSKHRSWKKNKNMQATKLRIKLRVRFAPIQLQAVDKNSQSIREFQLSRASELDFREIKQAKSTFFK